MDIAAAYDCAHKFISCGFDKRGRQMWWDNQRLCRISQKAAARVLKQFGITPEEYASERAERLQVIYKGIGKRALYSPTAAVGAAQAKLDAATARCKFLEGELAAARDAEDKARAELIKAQAAALNAKENQDEQCLS